MPAVVDSIAEAGVGDYDGQLKVIEYATEKQSMRWNDTLGMWLTEPRPVLRYKTDFGTGVRGGFDWSYFTQPEGNPGQLGRTGFGWTPQAIHRADAAYDAGLTFYEKIDYLFWAWDNPNLGEVATVYYNLDPSDMMSTLISATAADNVGTVINTVGAVGSRKMRTTGWVQSQIPTPTKSVLAPHLYCKGVTSAGPNFLEFITVHWRWGGDLGDHITVAADLTGLDDGEILVWDGTDSRFEPGAL